MARRVVWASLLIGFGWAVRGAARPEPEFMIAIDAPAGETRIECLSGCKLIGARDLPNRNAIYMKVYSYGCSGSGVQRCGAQVAGWRAH